MRPLVAFDLDGTLVDSRLDIATAANLALGDVGLPPRAPAEVQTFVGHGARRLVERCVWPRTDLLEPALAAWRRHYEVHLLDTTRAYPGVRELLAGLGEASTLAVATNKPGPFARRICDAIFPGAFAAVIGADEAPPKPDPAMLVKLLERFSVPAERCVFVGDMDVDRDVAAACGARFVGVGWGFAPAALGGEVAQDAAELLARIRGALGDQSGR